MIRIKPKQVEWLKKHKPYRTIAGYLDYIINDFKKYGYKQRQKSLPHLPRKRETDREVGMR